MGFFHDPVALVAAAETEVTVFSIKVAQWFAKGGQGRDGAPARGTGQAGAPTPASATSNSNQQHAVSVLLTHNGSLIYQTPCIHTGGRAVFRFTVPAGVLAEPSVLSAHVTLCGEQGSTVKVLDSGKLLVLEADAAAEVQALFQQTTQQVQQLVASTPSIPLAGQQQLPAQQPVRATAAAAAASGRQQGGTVASLLSRLRFNLKQDARNSGSSSIQGLLPGAAASPSTSASQQQQQQQQQALPTPDAAMLYAYEHFFVPLVARWALVFANSEADLMEGGSHQEAEIVQLLGVLLEHKLWACSLLVLGRYPALAAAHIPSHAQRSGVQAAAQEDASTLLLDQLRREQPQQPARMPASSGPVAATAREQQPRQISHPQQQQQQQQQQPQDIFWRQQQLYQQQQQQQLQHQQQQQQQQQQQHLQQLQHQQQMQQTAESLLLQYQHMLLLTHLQHQQQQHLDTAQPHGVLGSAAASQPAPWPADAPLAPQPAAAAAAAAAPGARSPCGSDDDSYESASEILMHLGLLQQARGEQEALQDYMQQQQQLEGGQPMQAQGQGQHTWASSAWSQPLPVVQPVAQAAAASQTAPLNVVALPGAAAAAVAVAVAAAAPVPMEVDDQEGCLPYASDMMQLLAPEPHAASPAAAVGAAADDDDGCGPACRATGLRQHRPAQPAQPAGSLFSKQRKLSWEEEQPEPVPRPPAPSAASPPLGDACATGWYPGSWQLPEPSSSPLFAHGRIAYPAAGFGAAVGALAAAPAVAAPAGRLLDGAPDPMAAVPQACYAGSVGGSWQQQLQSPAELVLQQQQQPSRPVLQQQPAQQVQQLQQQGSGDKWQLQDAACHAAERELAEGLSACGGPVSRPAPSLQEPASCGDDSKGSSSCAAAEDCAKQGGIASDTDGCGAAAGTCMDDTCGGGSSSSAGVSGGVMVPHPAALLSWQQPWELARVCARGFQDPSLEALYLVFKNHNCSLLDATAGFLCTAMLAAASFRSLRQDGLHWQLLTMLIYALFFFLPYIIMQLRLPLFLRLREQLLVFGRNTGCVILAMTALGYLPVVQVWKNVVCNTLSLQIQNGFILPSCQQVRLPAALAIAAVHVPADAIYLAIGRPFSSALLHSSLVQLCSVTVALVFDAVCRMRFQQRYSGLTAAGQLTELARRQV